MFLLVNPAGQVAVANRTHGLGSLPEAIGVHFQSDCLVGNGVSSLVGGAAFAAVLC